MISRLLASAFVFAFFLSTATLAVERESFSEERFIQLQEDDALILVDVWAKWCPTCAKQERILEAYAEARPDSGLHILVVDFDDQKEWVRHFRAPRQSTFFLYRGSEQIWFSVAETDQDTIFERLDTAVSP